MNGGKQFRSNLLGTAELTDWLLDTPSLAGASEAQGEVTRMQTPRAGQGPRSPARVSLPLLSPVAAGHVALPEPAGTLWSSQRRPCLVVSAHPAALLC